jgi:cytochrome c oxidase subunit 1
MSTLDFPIPSQRTLLRAWMFAAVGALAIAGVFAVLLAWSRVPGAQDVFAAPLQFFRRGLVIHVVFSFIVWFLAAFGALAAFAIAAQPAPAPRWTGRAFGIGILLLIGALPFLFAPAFIDNVEPSLNNYVPVLIHPAFYTGLVILICGAFAAAIATIGGGAWRDAFARLDGVTLTAGASALVFIGVLATGWLSLRALAGETPSFAFNENLFWGPGHTLQFMNIGLMIVAWALLLRPARAPMSRRAGLMFCLAAFFVAQGGLAGPLLFAITAPFSSVQILAYTDLQYLLAPAPLVAALGCARAWHDAGQPDIRDPRWLTVWLSIALFLIGGFLGLFVDGGDTRTPAHYHAVIAAVTVALMGCFHLVLVPAAAGALAPERSIRWQILLFSGGQMAASIGLFWAGGYGAPRKAAGADQGLTEIGAYAGLFLNGIGAAVAVAGGVWFIASVARALIHSRPAKDQGDRDKYAFGLHSPPGPPGRIGGPGGLGHLE